MVDSRQALESEYITVELVKNSKTKKAVIDGAGQYVDTEWGNRLEIDVDLDQKPKKWTLNKDTIKNISAACGYETENWVGKVINLNVVTINSKERIIGVPDVPTEEIVKNQKK